MKGVFIRDLWSVWDLSPMELPGRDVQGQDRYLGVDLDSCATQQMRHQGLRFLAPKSH